MTVADEILKEYLKWLKPTPIEKNQALRKLCDVMILKLKDLISPLCLKCPCYSDDNFLYRTNICQHPSPERCDLYKDVQHMIAYRDELLKEEIPE